MGSYAELIVGADAPSSLPHLFRLPSQLVHLFSRSDCD